MKIKIVLLSLGFLVIFLLGGYLLRKHESAKKVTFNGDRSYQDVITQVDFGPRIPGSEAHEELIAWSITEFTKAGWNAAEVWDYQSGHQVKNVVAKKGSGEQIIILGAHFDSRMIADRESVATTEAVPGANDGASGVAVLVELARVLEIPSEIQIWMVLFDAEDQGDLYGWDWILGSSAYAESLDIIPAAVVVVDMVGDTDLNLRKEQTGDQELVDQIWKIAADLGYSDSFIDEPGYGMLDDHTPFLNRGFRAIDIIDFDYPYWHTLSDMPEHVSPLSLEIVGRTIETWIEDYTDPN